MTLNRREFVQLAAAMGASLAWGGSARASTTGWHERRDLYPEGVASGDPDPSSVILWTRRPFESGGRRVLFRSHGVASGDPDPESVILWTRRPFESGGRRELGRASCRERVLRLV